jgi:hypothetical protein
VFHAGQFDRFASILKLFRLKIEANSPGIFRAFAAYLPRIHREIAGIFSERKKPGIDAAAPLRPGLSLLRRRVCSRHGIEIPREREYLPLTPLPGRGL